MKKEIDIKDYLKILVKWRRIIIFNVTVITLLAIVISLVLPKKWTAVTTILPPAEQSSSMGISALVGGGFGGLLGGGALSRMLPGMATLSDLFAKELTSRRIMIEVIEKNGLMKLYKTAVTEDALIKLKDFTAISVSPEGIISIAVTERSPKIASEIANSFVEELDKFNRDINMTFGKKNRLFLEERLKTVKEDLRVAEESLRVFKEKNKTVHLSTEMSAAVEVVSNIKAKIMAIEVQLGILYKFSSASNPEIIRMQNEIAQLKKKEREIEKLGKGKDSFGAGFSVPFEKVPEVSLKLARRMRDITIQETLFKLITEQYEQAKIMEMRDTPTIQVLDVAIPPEKRSFPQRKKLVVVAFLFSVFFSIGLSFLFEYVEKIKVEKEGKEWRDMGKILKEDLNLIFRKIRIRRGMNDREEN